ncbi:hypothetical protein HK097_009018 [Rhizophlyctis rosea]|uniref:Uncharacterized protein n=1 Tax=Rhizophlyctis rosea TaxID=64517 RepID=A0AAD5SB42_9FUNG|nr:hypothetical protein HK097_009018 [Rhizophlyctis rosea]
MNERIVAEAEPLWSTDGLEESQHCTSSTLGSFNSDITAKPHIKKGHHHGHHLARLRKPLSSLSLLLTTLPTIQAQSNPTTPNTDDLPGICALLAKPSNIVLLAAGLIANCGSLPSLVLSDQPHCSLASVLGALMLGVMNVVWGYRLLIDPNRHMRIHRSVVEYNVRGLLRQVEVLSSLGARNGWLRRWVGKMRVLWRVVGVVPSGKGRVRGTALHFMYARERKGVSFDGVGGGKGGKGWDRILKGNIWKPELAAVSEAKLRPLLNRFGGGGSVLKRIFAPFLPLLLYATILALGLYVCELCNFSWWLKGVMAAILVSGILKWLGAIMLRGSFAYAVSTVVVDMAHGNSNGFGARRRALIRGAGAFWLIAGLIDWGYLIVTGTLDDSEMNVVIAIVAIQAFIQLAAQHIAEPTVDIMGDTDWSA